MFEQKDFDFRKDIDGVTLEDFTKYCHELIALRAEKDAIELALTNKNKEISQLEYKVVQYLEEYKIDSQSIGGFTFGTKTEFKVKMPQETDKRRAVIEYLKRNGYENVLDVHYGTLNTIYNTEKELAIKEGRPIDGLIPGLDDPSTRVKLTMRAVRKG